MGCISSKAVMTRSTSFHEEVKLRRQQRTPNGIPVWEDLMKSQNGNDKFLAFLCSGNNVASLLRSGSFAFSSNRKAEDYVHDNELELAKGGEDGKGSSPPEVERAESRQHEVGSTNFNKFMRSRSCQWPSMQNERSFSAENESSLREKNTIGSRSFHTVEEYDSLLERIYGYSTKDTETNVNHYSSSQDVKCIHSECDENPQNNRVLVAERADCHNEGLRADDKTSSLIEDSDNVEEQGRAGWKRKAAAKELKSLEVPSIEFPVPGVARMRQKFHVEGQVYSPGTYVTPKFGSYNDRVNGERREGCKRDCVFSPELVAAFEECMQQLEEEEEDIVSYLNGCDHQDVNVCNGGIQDQLI